MWNDKEIREYRQFEQFYQKNLVNFCKEKGLNAYKETYDRNYKIGIASYERAIDSIDIKTIYLGDYGTDFVRYLLSHANKEEREQVVSNKFSFFSYESLALSSYEHPQDMKDIFKELGKENVFKSYSWERIIKDMQNNCDSKLYDEVIDIFLSKKKKEIKNKSNKIIINLMLNTVKDDTVYNKYNSLIPNNVINEDFFDNLEIVCFDLNVSKDKLYSSIPLPNKDKYNEMHNKLLENLDNESLKSKLGIVSIEGEAKFKSSKYYRYVCRLKEGSILDKESTKLLIISFCRLYSNIVNNVREDEREYELINNISPEMIHSNYLNYKLSKNLTEENKSNKEKKVKI